MRLSNLLVSFVSAIALASNVAASATPERRGSPPTQSCSTGDLTCCVSSTPFSSLSSATQSTLLGLVNPNLLLNLPVGLDCVVPGLLGCNNQASCCSGTQSLGGLIDIGLNCVNL